MNDICKKIEASVEGSFLVVKVDGKLWYKYDTPLKNKFTSKSVTSKYSYVKGVYGTGQRALNQSFTKEVGITPSAFAKMMNALQYKYLILPQSEWVKKYAYNRGKISENKYKSVVRMKEHLEQAKKDGIENIIPFIVKYEMTPHELKKYMGKGLWKSLCKNSHYKNYLIAEKDIKMRAAAGQSIPQSTTALRYGVEDSFLAMRDIKWKDVPTKGRAWWLQCLQRNARDYFRMQDEMGIPAEEMKWSNIDQLHNNAIRVYRERQRLSAYGEFNLPQYIPREFTEDGYVFTLLTTGQEVVDEGVEMHHCVGSYAGMVAKGQYLVYRVHKLNEDGTEERATLGIADDYQFRGGLLATVMAEKKWVYNQCYGKHNSSQKQEMKNACHSLIRKINKEIMK